MTQNSPNSLHSVNKPSLLTSLFKKPRGFLLLALTSYGCLHVQHSSFLCMSSLELFSSSLFLSTLIYVFMFFMCFNLPFEFPPPIWVPSPSSSLFLFSDYCAHTVTVQCILLLTHSLKEGPRWRSGRSLRPAGWASVLSERKIKSNTFHRSLSSFSTVGIQSTQNGLGARSATTEQDNHWQCIPLWCYCEQLQC